MKSLPLRSYRIYLGNRYQSDIPYVFNGNQYCAASILLWGVVGHPWEDGLCRFEGIRSGWIEF